MGMEHRWSERKPINMDVTMYYEPIGRIHGKTRNVSLEGMYIEIDGTYVPDQVELEISFVTQEGTQEHAHKVPAYVVHGGSNGIGVMLRHVGYNDFHALRHMLKAA